MKQIFPAAPVVDTIDAGAALPARRALIVDDSELALQFMERTLTGMGLRTHRAMRSDDALEQFASEPFDFVFLDIDLGEASEIDGLALCRHIKRTSAHAPGRSAPVVALVSVHAGEMDRVRGMLAGCDAFFGKPPDLRALGRLLALHGVDAPAPFALRPAAGAA